MIDRRIRRQYRLILLLRSKDLTSAKALADRCKVNIRTVYRDIEDLLQAGFPIEGMPGPEGGYRLTPDASLDASVFDDEISFRAFVLRSSHERRINDAGVAPVLDSPVGQGGDWMQLALAGKLYIQIEDGMYAEVGRAILNSEAILIRRKLKGESRQRSQEEVVVPLGLVLQLGNLYLVARDLTGDVFTEPLTKIEFAKTLNLSFNATEPFDVRGWWRDNGEFVDSERAASPRSKRA
jgi:predicted DNA-binding transcriptional regulator YafY